MDKFKARMVANGGMGSTLHTVHDVYLAHIIDRKIAELKKDVAFWEKENKDYQVVEERLITEIAELKDAMSNKILDNLEGFTFAGCSTSKLFKAIKFYDENHRTKLRLEKRDE